MAKHSQLVSCMQLNFSLCKYTGGQNKISFGSKNNIYRFQRDKNNVIILAETITHF